MSIKKQTLCASGVQFSNMLTGSLLDVNDRIDMALIGFNKDTGSPEYQYINISKYKMWNVSSVNQFKKNNLTVNLGASIIGVSQKIENQIFTSDDKFLYSFNLNSSVSYVIPRWETIFSAYYKYNGKSQQFIETTSAYVISEVDASNWLDVSVRKNLFNDKLEATIGARNLFDIKNVNQTRTNEGASHASSTEVLLAYGRSYFVKLTYNLNL
jgi:outer membrane receptor for ferrienterochelin and colicins